MWYISTYFRRNFFLTWSQLLWASDTLIYPLEHSKGICGLTFEFGAVVVNSFNFFYLLRLSFLLKPMFAIVTCCLSADNQNKYKSAVSCEWKIWLGALITILYSWKFFKSNRIYYYDKPDRTCNNFSLCLTVRKFLTFWMILKL